MKVLLKRAARVSHNAGEIVEVSPEQAAFLIGLGAAETVAEEAEKKKPATRTKKQ